MRARELLGRLRVLGFRANLDGGGLYIADTTGWRGDLSKFISPALVFDVLNAGLDDDPGIVAVAVSRTSEKQRIAREGRDRFVAEGWAEKGWPTVGANENCLRRPSVAPASISAALLGSSANGA